MITTCIDNNIIQIAIKWRIQSVWYNCNISASVCLNLPLKSLLHAALSLDPSISQNLARDHTHSSCSAKQIGVSTAYVQKKRKMTTNIMSEHIFCGRRVTRYCHHKSPLVGARPVGQLTSRDQCSGHAEHCRQLVSCNKHARPRVTSACTNIILHRLHNFSRKLAAEVQWGQTCVVNTELLHWSWSAKCIFLLVFFVGILLLEIPQLRHRLLRCAMLFVIS